jgi:hypothetical protein
VPVGDQKTNQFLAETIGVVISGGYIEKDEGDQTSISTVLMRGGQEAGLFSGTTLNPSRVA